MKIRKANLNDVNLLIVLRLDFLRMNGANFTVEEQIAIVAQMRNYFQKHIPLGDFIACLAEENGQVASAAYVVIEERPANGSFITGVVGNLINVLTYPEYRHAGLATRVIGVLIEECRQLGVSAIDLDATEMGRGVYERLGFKVMRDVAMRLKL